jgi:hypothetical protein
LPDTEICGPPTAISRANTEINFKDVCFIFSPSIFFEISTLFVADA